MATVLTQQDDTVDLVALRHYGSTTMVEAILAANPGLSAHGAKLPHGLTVTLPPAKAKSRPAPITLWT